MLTSMVMGMQGVNYSHNAQATLFNNAERQMSLANSATGYESMNDVARMAAVDKALALESARAQTMYLAGMAMREAAQNMQKRDNEMRQNLRNAGAIFV